MAVQNTKQTLQHQPVQTSDSATQNKTQTNSGVRTSAWTTNSTKRRQTVLNEPVHTVAVPNSAKHKQTVVYKRVQQTLWRSILWCSSYYWVGKHCRDGLPKMKGKRQNIFTNFLTILFTQSIAKWIDKTRRVGPGGPQLLLKKIFLTSYSMVSMGLFSDTLKSMFKLNLSTSAVNTLERLLLCTMRMNSSAFVVLIGVGVNWPMKDAPELWSRTEMVVMNLLHFSLSASITLSK